MSTFNVMIVDDERLARVRLRKLLEEIEHVRVVDEAGTLAEARERLARNSPHILFLDIGFSQGDGFDLLPHVPPGAAVVFVTAHPDYAVRAFQEDALDYLLKPVGPERLLQAVEKYRRQVSAKNASGSSTGFALLGDRSNWRRVPVEKISAIFAEGAYSRVFTDDGASVLMLRPLKEWEHYLKEADFVRLDRSVLVNARSVSSVSIRSRDETEVKLRGLPEPVHLGRVGTARTRKLLAAFVTIES